jgi:dTDP-4-dehydrorhamnose reductase
MGLGNLGYDLYRKLKSKDENTVSAVWEKNYHNEFSFGINPEVIWYCIGAGSVEKSQTNPSETLDAHVVMPLRLAEQFPKARIIAFSTDYTASPSYPSDRLMSRTLDECQSTYAVSKLVLEDVLPRYTPNSTIVRVSSLYGTKNPHKCFPYKALKATKLEFPENETTPTPTKWLADILVNNVELLMGVRVLEHVAPRGRVSYYEWAKMIRSDATTSERYDVHRPGRSELGCSLYRVKVDHWRDLWDTYGKEFLEHVKNS